MAITGHKSRQQTDNIIIKYEIYYESKVWFLSRWEIVQYIADEIKKKTVNKNIIYILFLFINFFLLNIIYKYIDV